MILVDKPDIKIGMSVMTLVCESNDPMTSSTLKHSNHAHIEMEAVVNYEHTEMSVCSDLMVNI